MNKLTSQYKNPHKFNNRKYNNIYLKEVSAFMTYINYSLFNIPKSIYTPSIYSRYYSIVYTSILFIEEVTIEAKMVKQRKLTPKIELYNHKIKYVF